MATKLLGYRLGRGFRVISRAQANKHHRQAESRRGDSSPRRGLTACPAHSQCVQGNQSGNRWTLKDVKNADRPGYVYENNEAMDKMDEIHWAYWPEMHGFCNFPRESGLNCTHKHGSNQERGANIYGKLCAATSRVFRWVPLLPFPARGFPPRWDPARSVRRPLTGSEENPSCWFWRFP